MVEDQHLNDCIPWQILMELGRLMPIRDLLAARSSCRTWRAFLTQQCFSGAEDSRLTVAALPCHSCDTFAKKTRALASIFPHVAGVIVFVGSRVTKEALDKEIASLAVAYPGLQSLELKYLQPCKATLDGMPSMTVMGEWLLPDATPVTIHDALPRGLSNFPSLSQLKIVREGPPGLSDLAPLPTTLNSLQLPTLDTPSGISQALTALQALGPRFQHLHLSLGCNRAFNASGISALPQCLKGLHLHGILDIGELEMKALLDLQQLEDLKIEVPSDRYRQAAHLLCAHPSLASLSLTLNQDESQLDMQSTLPMGVVLLHFLHQANGRDECQQPRNAGLPYGPTRVHTNKDWASGKQDPNRSALSHVQHPLDRLTSLTLQSCSIQPPFAAPDPWGAGASRSVSSFLDLLCCLTGLQSLAIEEPVPFEVPMRGSLTQLSTLTGLRTLVVSLMAGLDVPALTVTPEVATVLSASCPHLHSLSALNAIRADEDSSFSFLASKFPGLQTLSLMPCAHNHQHHNQQQQQTVWGEGSNTAAHANGAGHQLAHHLPQIDLSRDLPRGLRSLTLHGFSIISMGLPAFSSSLVHLSFSGCALLPSGAQLRVESFKQAGKQCVCGQQKGEESSDKQDAQGQHIGGPEMLRDALSELSVREASCSKRAGREQARLEGEPQACPQNVLQCHHHQEQQQGQQQQQQMGQWQEGSCLQVPQDQTPQSQQQSKYCTGADMPPCKSSAPLLAPLAPEELLSKFDGLESLQLSHVEGLHDGIFPHLSTLTALTTLHVLPLPQPPSELGPDWECSSGVSEW